VKSTFGENDELVCPREGRALGERERVRRVGGFGIWRECGRVGQAAWSVRGRVAARLGPFERERAGHLEGEREGRAGRVECSGVGCLATAGNTVPYNSG